MYSAKSAGIRILGRGVDALAFERKPRSDGRNNWMSGEGSFPWIDTATLLDAVQRGRSDRYAVAGSPPGRGLHLPRPLPGLHEGSRLRRTWNLRAFRYSLRAVLRRAIEGLGFEESAHPSRKVGVFPRSFRGLRRRVGKAIRGLPGALWHPPGRHVAQRAEGVGFPGRSLQASQRRGWFITRSSRCVSM